MALLAPVLAAMVLKDDHRLADEYSDTALRRVWRCTHFSWWMTQMLHRSPDQDAFDLKLQLSQLRYVTTSPAAAPAKHRQAHRTRAIGLLLLAIACLREEGDHRARALRGSIPRRAVSGQAESPRRT